MANLGYFILAYIAFSYLIGWKLWINFNFDKQDRKWLDMPQVTLIFAVAPVMTFLVALQSLFYYPVNFLVSKVGPFLLKIARS